MKRCSDEDKDDQQEDHDPDLRGDPGDHLGVHTGQLAGLVLRTGPAGRQEQRAPPSPPSSALSPHCPPRCPRGSRPPDRRRRTTQPCGGEQEDRGRPATPPDNNPYPLPASDGKDKGQQDKDLGGGNEVRAVPPVCRRCDKCPCVNRLLPANSERSTVRGRENACLRPSFIGPPNNNRAFTFKKLRPTLYAVPPPFQTRDKQSPTAFDDP
ncbi:hypothetical protein MTO96_009245 [Rhipicephalus appendiculatus]